MSIRSIHTLYLYKRKTNVNDISFMQTPTQYISNNPNPDYQKLALKSGKNVSVQHVYIHVFHDPVTLIYI